MATTNPPTLSDPPFLETSDSASGDPLVFHIVGGPDLPTMLTMAFPVRDDRRPVGIRVDLMFGAEEFLFAKHTEAPRDPPDASLLSTGNNRQVEYVYLPAGNSHERSLVVVSHGEHWQPVALEQPYILQWKQWGSRLCVDVLLHNYPCFGKTSGPLSTNNILGDLRSLMLWAQKRGEWAPDRIIILGHGTGCGPAAQAAAWYPSSRVVLISPAVFGIHPYLLYHFTHLVEEALQSCKDLPKITKEILDQRFKACFGASPFKYNGALCLPTAMGQWVTRGFISVAGAHEFLLAMLARDGGEIHQVSVAHPAYLLDREIARELAHRDVLIIYDERDPIFHPGGSRELYNLIASWGTNRTHSATVQSTGPSTPGWLAGEEQLRNFVRGDTTGQTHYRRS